jgi:hypothetical protein
MIAIKIGTAERRDGDINARWITGSGECTEKKG